MDFEYVWIVFNQDYVGKHRIWMEHKQTKTRGGNGYNLWLLYKEKKIDSDASFLGYMNNKIFNVKNFKKLQSEVKQ